jgi:uroporphyrinogen III methyltransferase / synthase
MSGARPLQGRRVLVTRGVEKADRLPGLLEEAGAEVLRVPLIATERLVTALDISRAVDRLIEGVLGGERPRWLVLTSAMGAELAIEAVGAERLSDVAIAVIGPATAAELSSHGIDVELVAPEEVGESLAAELAQSDLDGARVLLIAAAGGRNVIAPLLTSGGARVEVLHAYRSVMPEGAREQLLAVFAGAEPVDAITFTSGSTVRHCAEALAVPPRGCAAVCIGPVTADAARAAGWQTVITAAEHTADGIVAAMVAHLAPVHPLP